MIKGITVQLHQKTSNSVDAFNHPIVTTSKVNVNNVLVAPASETEILETVNLTGRRAVYTLAIPKGDDHNWVDTKVEFFGKTWHTIGMPIGGIEAMIPLDWNYKVRVELYE